MVKIIYFLTRLILTSCNNFIPGMGKWKENISKTQNFHNRKLLSKSNAIKLFDKARAFVRLI